MRYVHEFVDKMACMRCPHNAPATEENGWEGFDFVCYAREDGDEFLFPEECSTYFGPWGAWRSIVADLMDRVLQQAPDFLGRVEGIPCNFHFHCPDLGEDLFAAIGWSP